MAKGSKTKPNYRPKTIATNLDNIPIPVAVERKRGKGHTARALPRRLSRVSPPPFEVQGCHVLILIAALMGAAQLAGLLPDP